MNSAHDTRSASWLLEEVEDVEEVKINSVRAPSCNRNELLGS